MNGTELALQLLPPRFLDRQGRESCARAEELRLRVGQPPMLLVRGKEFPFSDEMLSEEDLRRILEKATGASLHSVAPAMAKGYISYRGLRIGLCGAAVIQSGKVTGFRGCSSMAVRIPRECRGICDEVLQKLEGKRPVNLLILSPPGGGKTTALRELVRCLSLRGARVGLIDERCEIAACEGSRAQFDLGPHCDVLSGVPKAAGAMMLLRGMNPEIIAMDEITQAADLDAIREIVGCGVRLLATAHAASREDLRRRPLYRVLLDEHIFDCCVVIDVRAGERQLLLEEL